MNSLSGIAVLTLIPLLVKFKKHEVPGLWIFYYRFYWPIPTVLLVNIWSVSGKALIWRELMISNDFDTSCLVESWLSCSNALKAMKLLLCFAVVYLILSFKSFKSINGIVNVNVLWFIFIYLFLITCMLSPSIITSSPKSSNFFFPLVFLSNF